MLKTTLSDRNDLGHIARCPLSNLSLISKLLEKTAAKWFSDQACHEQDLGDKLQSAYTKLQLHSTETALMKVQNDILEAGAILILLDNSSAFDTSLLLQTLQANFCVKEGAHKFI